MENLGGGNKDKKIRDKSLKLKIKGLDPAQQDIYYEALMRRRKELWEEGERNVPLDEREEILEGVKSGKIKAEDVQRTQKPAAQKKRTTGMGGNVTPEQLEESRKKGFPTFIEKSLPKGDRD